MTEDTRERFVVVADDYGIRQTAEPILRLVREGKIDRVSVLIHYVSHEQAEALLATGVKIDLHLELIGLLKRGYKMHENTFLRGANFLWRYFFGLLTAKKVETEWRDQIERFHELFRRYPDGLNSHEYVHHFPKFFRVFLGLAKRYDIGYVRFGKKGMLTDMHSALVGNILSFLWKQTKTSYEKQPVPTSDYLVSFDWFGDFNAFAKQVPQGPIELVVHPEREDEYRALLEYL
ncbi:MAG: ChbG/HpnK family deacetylase [Candidatus Moranbacteria bacterium]|nr:ChbG/HpnK family deacetylase [Candidatus Moranbacteria bacterium]